MSTCLLIDERTREWFREKTLGKWLARKDHDAISTFRIRDYRWNGNLGALGEILSRAISAAISRLAPQGTTINIAITLFHSRLLRASINEEASTTPLSRTYGATCPLRSLAAPALRSSYARVRSYTIHVDRTIYTDRSLRGKTRNNHCAPSRRTSRYRPSSTSLSCHRWHSVVTRYMISLGTTKSNSFRFTNRASNLTSCRGFLFDF